MYSSLIHSQRLLLLYNKLLIISKHVRSSPNFLFLLKNNFPGNFWTAKIWTRSSLCPPLVLDTLHYHFNSLHCRISYFLGSISCWGRKECLFVYFLFGWSISSSIFLIKGCMWNIFWEFAYVNIPLFYHLST